MKGMEKRMKGRIIKEKMGDMEEESQLGRVGKKEEKEEKRKE